MLLAGSLLAPTFQAQRIFTFKGRAVRRLLHGVGAFCALVVCYCNGKVFYAENEDKPWCRQAF